MREKRKTREAEKLSRMRSRGKLKLFWNSRRKFTDQTKPHSNFSSNSKRLRSKLRIYNNMSMICRIGSLFTFQSKTISSTKN